MKASTRNNPKGEQASATINYLPAKRSSVYLFKSLFYLWEFLPSRKSFRARRVFEAFKYLSKRDSRNLYMDAFGYRMEARNIKSK